MNILLVNYEYYPQGGGAGLATHNMARAFADAGNKVGVIIGWDQSYGVFNENNGIEYYLIPLKKKNIHQSTVKGLLGFVFKGMFTIRKLTKREDWDIIMFYFSVPTGILKYGIKGRVPYVISLRGMDIPGLNSVDYNALTKLTKHINRAIVKKSAATLSLSRAAADKYSELLPDKRIIVIPNCLDVDLYKKKTVYKDRITRFVAVSRLIKVKKLDILIEAFVRVHKEYNEIVLDIIGDGREYDSLNDLIRSRSASAYIRLRGYMPREEIIGSLPEYDAFALTSIGDSFGVAFLEAMAAGLPVLCARAGGPAEVVIDGVTGVFVEPDDVGSTEKGLRYLVDNPLEAKNMGERGRERVEKEYSIKGVADRHLKVFDNILK